MKHLTKYFDKNTNDYAYENGTVEDNFIYDEDGQAIGRTIKVEANYLDAYIHIMDEFEEYGENEILIKVMKQKNSIETGTVTLEAFVKIEKD